MKIAPISFAGINNRSTVSAKKSLFNDLNYDNVSFTSNIKSQNGHIDEAVSLGYEVYFNFIRKSGFNAQKFISRKERDVEVLSIDELQKIRPDASNYCAYFSCEYDDDVKPTDMKLYIADKQKTSSSKAHLINAMNIAHEYTHLIQTKDCSDAEFLRELSGGDNEYLLLLNGIGGAVFSIFDTTIQANFIQKTMDFSDGISILQYGQIVPKARNVDEIKFLKVNDLKSPDEFNKLLNELFYSIFAKVFDDMNYNSPNIEPRVKDAFLSFLAKGGSSVQLRNDVKKYCSFVAKTEFEAYTTESELAKKIIRTDDSLNVDVFPIYYNLLSNALS